MYVWIYIHVLVYVCPRTFVYVYIYINRHTRMFIMELFIKMPNKLLYNMQLKTTQLFQRNEAELYGLIYQD